MNHKQLIEACAENWNHYTQHTFVEQLASGTLDERAYCHYLKQDFLFLKQYARAYALAIYKGRDLKEMRMALPSVQALLDAEISHHIEYSKRWGLQERDLEAEPEAFGTIAYTRYVLDAGMTGDICDLYVALAPCSLGYGVIGQNLLSDSNTLLEGNPYRSWIELYGGEEYQSGAQLSATQLDELLADIDINSQKGQHLCQVFDTATRMEIAFWQQGLDAAV